jgi:hypothetical protein
MTPYVPPVPFEKIDKTIWDQANLNYTMIEIQSWLNAQGWTVNEYSNALCAEAIKHMNR